MEVQHDDHAQVETKWHEGHAGAFHHFSKGHKDRLVKRLSSIGPVIEEPKDISTRLTSNISVTHARMHTHNLSTTLLDFVRDYPGEPAPERKNLEGKTNLDLLEQEIVSGNGIRRAVHLQDT